MFSVRVLASGSSGNATYVRAGRLALLFDAGIPRRPLVELMQAAGIPPRLDAIFLSHEHVDHLRGVRGMHQLTNAPVYLSPGTLDAAPELTDVDSQLLEGGVELDNALITPLAVPHDAAEPLNFVVRHKEHSLGIFTDLGHANAAVKDAFSQLDCAVLEANHSIDMLWKGPYPLELKQRISSPLGHLSNEEAAALLMECSSPTLAAVFIAHRSEHNNTRDRSFATLDHARRTLQKKGHSDFALLHTERREPTKEVEVGHGAHR